MVVRLFVLLIAMILVARPVDAAGDEPCIDAAAELSVAEPAAGDDVACAHPLVVAPVRWTTLATPRDRDTIPSTPALAGIFRPPRAALA